MPYNTTPDPYIDPGTGVLKNLLGIKTGEKLEDAEADITATVIASMSEQTAPDSFDLSHLKSIHKELFSTIYAWAGQIRTVEMAKENTRFANSDVIEEVASRLFKKLREENLLKNLPRDQYVKRLAHYYSEINILHPFREGNGRTQRVYFSQLAAMAGYRLAWERLDPDENLRACIKAYEGDEGLLAQMLDMFLESTS